MKKFNINNLSNEQKGFLALLLGFVLLLQGLRILQLQSIMLVIAAILLFYGIVKTNLWDRIVKTVHNYLNKNKN